MVVGLELMVRMVVVMRPVFLRVLVIVLVAIAGMTVFMGMPMQVFMGVDVGVFVRMDQFSMGMLMGVYVRVFVVMDVLVFMISFHRFFLLS
jgi:hypothetical protein